MGSSLKSSFLLHQLSDIQVSLIIAWEPHGPNLILMDCGSVRSRGLPLSHCLGGSKGPLHPPPDPCVPLTSFRRWFTSGFCLPVCSELKVDFAPPLPDSSALTKSRTPPPQAHPPEFGRGGPLLTGPQHPNFEGATALTLQHKESVVTFMLRALGSLGPRGPTGP